MLRYARMRHALIGMSPNGSSGSPYWGVLRALPEWRGAPRGLALAAADAESLVAAMRAAEREALRATTRPALAVTR